MARATLCHWRQLERPLVRPAPIATDIKVLMTVGNSIYGYASGVKFSFNSIEKSMIIGDSRSDGI